jgi:ketosteroid isomerase-like protein
VSSRAEENKALVRRFLEAQVKGDLDAMDEMMAPDFVGHTKLLPDQEPDREGKKRAYAHFSAATSNPSIHFEDQVAAGEKVVTRFVVHATHDRGELMGVVRLKTSWAGIGFKLQVWIYSRYPRCFRSVLQSPRVDLIPTKCTW